MLGRKPKISREAMLRSKPTRNEGLEWEVNDEDEVVITIASASGAVIRELVNQADEAGVTAKIIPGISEILDGKVNLSRIRSVSIEDLLGREAVHLETDLVGQMLAAKTVQGGEVKIDASSGVKIDNANVTQADISTDNGVIHVIDAVILPKS